MGAQGGRKAPAEPGMVLRPLSPNASCFFGKPTSPCRDDVWEFKFASPRETMKDFQGRLYPLRAEELRAGPTKELIDFVRNPVGQRLFHVLLPWELFDLGDVVLGEVKLPEGLSHLNLVNAFWSVSGATGETGELTTLRLNVMGGFFDTPHVFWISLQPRSILPAEWAALTEKVDAGEAVCLGRAPTDNKRDACQSASMKAYFDFVSSKDVSGELTEVAQLLRRTSAAWSQTRSKDIPY
ncbi:hypothetical protein MEBOL_005069 [Melittangium boletus DSM 14713]|uniref:Uncharacterized protein n=2 Tax=Melittangium boletus TaxID=83453 RepID=A0A250IKY9_9BACT|nr:hypothetical protein MEBOL_005069 [Melittangium boletus DSM 14713]